MDKRGSKRYDRLKSLLADAVAEARVLDPDIWRTRLAEFLADATSAKAWISPYLDEFGKPHPQPPPAETYDLMRDDAVQILIEETDGFVQMSDCELIAQLTDRTPVEVVAAVDMRNDFSNPSGICVEATAELQAEILRLRYLLHEHGVTVDWRCSHEDETSPRFRSRELVWGPEVLDELELIPQDPEQRQITWEAVEASNGYELPLVAAMQRAVHIARLGG